MLSIYFGEKEDIYYGPSWFVNSYEGEWLSDPFVGDMIKDVDKSEYRGGELIFSDLLGPIAPKDLSGGVKTLISIYKNPDMIFDATSCGDNCAKWLLKIGEKEDVTIVLQYLMHFEDYEPFKIRIENSGQIVSSGKEYVMAALDELHKR